MGMSKQVYRLAEADVQDLRAALSHADVENENELTPRQKVIARTFRETVKPRQRELLALYFVEGFNQNQIAQQKGINVSTVSRTTTNGLRHINQALFIAALPQIAHSSASTI